MQQATSPAGDRPDSIKRPVPAVARAARLLDALAEAREPVSLAALTAELGLPKSTVHGLCATLVQSGLVTRFDNGTYHLGMRVMGLAHAFLARTDMTVEFNRVLEEMRPMPEESIVLSILDGPDVVYVACRNGTRPFGFNFRFGMRLPVNCTASGKALLSSLPPERVAELTRGGRFYGLTQKSVTDLEALQHQLARVRQQGYAFDNEETRIGIVCFGAPVFKATGSEAVAAVGVSLPKAALDREQKALAIQTVKDVAARLSARLGAR